MTITKQRNEVGLGTVQRNARIKNDLQMLNQNNNIDYAEAVNQSAGFYDATGLEYVALVTWTDIENIIDMVIDERGPRVFRLHVYGKNVTVRATESVLSGTATVSLTSGSDEWGYVDFTVGHAADALIFTYEKIYYALSHTLYGAFITSGYLTTAELP